LVFSRHPQPFASNPSTVAAGPSGADVNATKEVRFQDLVGFVGATAPDLRDFRDVMEYQQPTMGWIIYNNSTTLELHFGIADWGHCFDGIYFLAFYKLTYRPLSSHPTMYRGTTMYTTSTILQRACQAPFGTERSMCVLGFLDCWRVIYPSQAFTNERSVDMPGSTLQRECCGGSVSVSATPKTKWRSGKGGAVMKNKKGQGEGWNWNLSFVSGFSISRSLKLRRSSIFSG
jgi:hypothetical protein